MSESAAVGASSTPLEDGKVNMIIETHNLTKTFTKSNFNWRTFKSEKTDKVAVDNVSIEIKHGEFVGFLGPNGAGKTTFLKMLSGIIYPTGGSANALGYTPWERKNDYLRQIAIVMGQKNQLWWDLPAFDSYELLRAVYDIDKKLYKKNLELISETLNMGDLLGKRLREMSLGERMKCELAACFLHDPKVVFLDEPTIGLDVISAHAIRDFLKKINREKGCTLILTSHYMLDVEELCERVIVIDHGKKIYDGTLDQMRTRYAPEKVVSIFLENLDDKAKFAHLNMTNKHLVESRGIIRVQKTELAEVVKCVYEQFEAEKISINNPDTEEIISKIFSGAGETVGIMNNE